METRSRSSVLSFAIASILATGIVTTHNVLAAGLHENIRVTHGHTVSPAEERIMMRSAARVLRYIAETRSAINAKNIGNAKSDLQQVRSLINILKSQMPTTKVRDHIWVARQHLDYDSTREVTADLVPIEEDLTEIEDFVPVKEARRHTRAAHEHLKQGDRTGAKKELKAADAALLYTEVDLPLSGTERQVIAAQKALDNNQPAQADKALKQAEGGIRVLATAVEAPVTQARNSLWKASKDYAARDYAAARADLTRAGVWLDKAAQSTDKTTREEAIKLRHSLKSVKGKIAQTGKGTGSSLTSLWLRTRALAERESEKASASWGKMRSESTVKSDLIEAKLHLAYAESAQFVQGKSAEVSNELDQAQGYLDKATKTSDKVLTEKIHVMNDELKQLKANMDDKGAKAHARYDKVKADLRQTIRDL